MPHLLDTCGTGGDSAHTFNILHAEGVDACGRRRVGKGHAQKHGGRSGCSSIRQRAAERWRPCPRRRRVRKHRPGRPLEMLNVCALSPPVPQCPAGCAWSARLHLGRELGITCAARRSRPNGLFLHPQADDDRRRSTSATSRRS